MRSKSRCLLTHGCTDGTVSHWHMLGAHARLQKLNVAAVLRVVCIRPGQLATQPMGMQGWYVQARCFILLLC